MNLATKLFEIREAANISRAQLSSLLEKRGFDIKPYTIGKWETGASKPTVEAFLVVCDILDVVDIRSVFSFNRQLRLYDISVSAGIGNPLDDDHYELIETDDTVPASADYAVRVSGDSMAPRFIDRQIIFVQQQSTLEQGEIGIFLLNNQTYLKKLDKTGLVSFNAKYEIIPVNEFDNLRVLGKVVG